MVESERSHRSGRRRRRSASEFFLCFSWRSSSSSSSSMKISSKSILSPGRSREPSLSLSSSLSRRLRSNGSMKGGQSSPMFPTGSKKKGSSFEPPEPSSPKVTCIGQVRVKSKKKHGRKLRNRSQRRGGEISFRKTEQNQDGNGINGIHHQQQQSQECLPHRNQRWVHLPLSICETLRAFGAEFNCFVPCGGRSSSSCSWSSEREKVEKRRGSNGGTGSSGSCGAVFARWLFALQENEEKGREIETDVMREEEKRVEREVVREIEMEISEEKLEITKGEIEVEEEEEGRESICIPPKNALLLMRSRSAPFRMSSLANRFWESPAPQDNMEKLELEEDDDDDEEEDELDVNRTIIEERHGVIDEEEGNKDREVKVKLEEETKEEEMVDKWDSAENFVKDTNLLKEEEIAESQIKVEEDEEALESAELRQEEEQVQEPNEAVMVNGSSLNEGKLQIEEREEEFNLLEVEEEEEVKEVLEKKRVSFSASSTMYFEPESEEEEEEALEAVVPLEETAVEKSTEEEVSEEEKDISTSRSSTEQHSKSQEGERETETSALLPECLLLMMCEPKLSMEVSKETWVCSTDFVKFRHPEKKAVQKNGGDESIKKKRLSKVANPVCHTLVAQQPRQQQQKQTQIQPARSSYSKVEPVVAKSMGTVVEKKLVNAGDAYEPFVLKRCKSEPMRNSAKLAPEVCFWKKNKLEPHPPPSVGVGATGIGF
ncbi:Serine/Threonine-kinase pakA-like protein [Thalictrum thalictroides]|uniref:Serine/Threonine-kinase pakA-like protein n=1 Tax=Thalictrum thalictroides TaxID=46969 RepID=A0A7J6XD10_THATH|nr:Serine/Threonine-kinase pakA-like protein [Thalictrum thalictroides]